MSDEKDALDGKTRELLHLLRKCHTSWAIANVGSGDSSANTRLASHIAFRVLARAFALPPEAFNDPTMLERLNSLADSTRVVMGTPADAALALLPKASA